MTLLAGESQSGKTLVALYLAFCVAIGAQFFGKDTKRGGTLFVAAEGYDTLPMRLEALRLGLAAPIMAGRLEAGRPVIDVSKLPIFFVNGCPNLLLPDNEARLMSTLRKADEESQERFGIPITLVIVDTITSAFAIPDWNSASHTMQAMKVLNRIIDKRFTVVGLAHHGKDINKGPAGSFVLTAAPDSIIAAFRNVNSDGSVNERQLSLVKSRNGQTRIISGFELAPQRVFKHPDGHDVVSVHVVPIENTAGMASSKTKRKKDSRGLSAFKRAFEAAERESGERRQLYGDGLEQVVVPYESVKDEFDRRYAKGNEKPDSLRTAFTRALKEARQVEWVNEGNWDDADWLWRDPDL